MNDLEAKLVHFEATEAHFRAIEVLEQLVATHPENLEYRYKLGLHWLSVGQARRAERLFQECARSGYDNPLLGKYLAAIGSPGNGDGEFHYPLSVAVDAATSELVVLDMKAVNNTLYYTTTKINGARIQFFDLRTGEFKRGYELYGTVLASADLMRPVQLTVDGQSRLDVTDASFEEVKGLDRTCNFLGVVDDDALPLSTPLGIALGATNRLYVVSHNANRLDVFNLEDVTSLEADPLTASFSVNYGVLEATAQSISMTND